MATGSGPPPAPVPPQLPRAEGPGEDGKGHPWPHGYSPRPASGFPRLRRQVGQSVIVHAGQQPPRPETPAKKRRGFALEDSEVDFPVRFHGAAAAELQGLGVDHGLHGFQQFAGDSGVVELLHELECTDQKVVAAEDAGFVSVRDTSGHVAPPRSVPSSTTSSCSSVAA
jgi:hypothetical protein